MEFRYPDGTIRVTEPDRAALLARAGRRLAAGQGFALATINLDHLVKLRRDAAFRAAYLAHDMVVADGNPVVWLSRLAGRPVRLVPGSDLVLPLAGLAAAAGRPLVLVGSTEAALAGATERLRAAVPGLAVAMAESPPMGFDPDGPAARALLARIAALGPCLVFVALGAPKQERLAALGRQLAPAAGFASVGAGLDFLAGRQRRAPQWMRALALEWLWRMALSPRRLVLRYAACAALLPGEALAALRLRG